MNKLRILVVHEVGYLSKLVYEFQILSEALSLLGHQVTVIDYEDSWQAENGRPVIDLSTRVFRDVHRAYDSVCRRRSRYNGLKLAFAHDTGVPLPR